MRWKHLDESLNISLWPRRRLAVPDPLTRGREDEEDDAGEEPGPKGQVLEELLDVGPGVREEAGLHVQTAERQGQEQERCEDGVEVVPQPYPVLAQVLEDSRPVLVKPVVVEDVEALEGCQPVVQLTCFAESIYKL